MHYGILLETNKKKGLVAHHLLMLLQLQKYMCASIYHFLVVGFFGACFINYQWLQLVAFHKFHCMFSLEYSAICSFGGSFIHCMTHYSFLVSAPRLPNAGLISLKWFPSLVQISGTLNPKITLSGWKLLLMGTFAWPVLWPKYRAGVWIGWV